MQKRKADSRRRNDGLELLAIAVRAPSSHNTQPWRFRIESGGVSVHADRQRRLPVNDPDDRELHISCGCALMNLRVAAAASGQGYRLEPFPDGDGSSCLARLDFRDDAPDADEAGFAAMVERRRTCRQRFAPSAVPHDAIEALEAMAEAEGARLQIVEPGEPRRAVARLVEQGDAIQWQDPRWRRELAAWIRPKGRGDGLAAPALLVPFARAVVRALDMGGRVGAHDRELAEHAPCLVVLSTDGDERRDWLRAGQALERVLLAACELGLQASYLNQPVQVETLRPRLRETLGTAGHPQVVLRLGYPARDLPATPRRPLNDVIEVHSR
jgi:nitroreductase